MKVKALITTHDGLIENKEYEAALVWTVDPAMPGWRFSLIDDLGVERGYPMYLFMPADGVEPI